MTYTIAIVPQGYVVSTAYINVTLPEEVIIGDTGKLSG